MVSNCVSVVASFPRSGRGWLRKMLETVFLFDSEANVDRRNAELEARLQRVDYRDPDDRSELYPRVEKTHALLDEINHLDRDLPRILLCRQPIDALVSFHHFRSSNRGVFQGSILESLHSTTHGVPRLASWYNSWGTVVDDSMVLTYEELRANPADVVTRVLSYIDWSTKAPLDDIVEMWAFDRRKAHSAKELPHGTSPDAFGVRSGKIGGGFNEVTETAIAYVAETLRERLTASGERLLEAAGYGGKELRAL